MRYLFLLLSLLILVGCSSQQTENAKENDGSVHTEQRKIPEYVEVICPECDGVGKVKADAGYRVIMGIITLGPGALDDTKQCNMCNGRGTVRKKVLPDSLSNNYDKLLR